MGTTATLTDKEMGVATEAAKAGGKILLDYYKEGVYRQHYKEDTSLQTTADLESERVIIETILRTFPDHNIDSEERGLITSESTYKWLVDALDGTENFVLGIPYFSSSITLCDGGKPQIAVVYNPITDDLFTAAKGRGAWLNGNPIHVSNETQLRKCRAFFIPDFTTKRQRNTAHFRDKLYMQCRRLLDTWSPALDWCLVASGKVDVVLSIAGNPIRPDAGTLILEEAGGKVTDFYNRPFDELNNGCIVGSNSLIHDQLLELIREDYYTHDHYTHSGD